MSGYIPPPPPMPEEEAVTPSLEDCLDPPGTSSHPAVHTTSAPIEVDLSKPSHKFHICCRMCIYLFRCHFLHVSLTLLHMLQPLPEEYQVLLAEHNSLVEKDVDELMQSMKEQIKQIMAKRGAELAYKMNRLNTEKDVANLATKLSHVKKPSNDNEIMHAPSPVEPGKKTCSPLESTEHASTSTPPTPREESTRRTESFPSTEPTTGEHQKTKSVPSTNPTRGEHQREPNPSSPPILPLEESTKEPNPSRPPNPPKDSRKEPNASPTVSASKGHYVLINLFGPEDALFEDVCGEGSRSPSPTGKYSDFFTHLIFLVQTWLLCVTHLSACSVRFRVISVFFLLFQVTPTLRLPMRNKLGEAHLKKGIEARGQPFSLTLSRSQKD